MTARSDSSGNANALARSGAKLATRSGGVARRGLELAAFLQSDHGWSLVAGGIAQRGLNLAAFLQSGRIPDHAIPGKERAAIYLDEEAGEGRSLGAQKHLVEELISDYGWPLVVLETYSDPKWSSEIEDLPGLQRMLAELDRFDVVFAHGLDLNNVYTTLFFEIADRKGAARAVVVSGLLFVMTKSQWVDAWPRTPVAR